MLKNINPILFVFSAFAISIVSISTKAGGTEFYGSLMAGYGNTSLTGLKTGDDEGSFSIGNSGPALALRGGVRWFSSRVRYGVEAIVSYFWQQYEFRDESDVTRITPGFRTTLAPTLGYRIADPATLWTKVGYAYGKFDFEENDNSPNRFSDNLHGFVVGAGLELDLDEDMSLRTDIEFARFQNWKVFSVLRSTSRSSSNGWSGCNIASNKPRKGEA